MNPTVFGCLIVKDNPLFDTGENASFQAMRRDASAILVNIIDNDYLVTV